MLQEGFFDNINANPLPSLRKMIIQALDGTINTYFSIKTESSVKKYLPDATVSISERNILTLSSAQYPDIKYEFDITPAINDIIKAITSAGIQLSEVRWDDLNIGWAVYSGSRINVYVGVTKRKMTLQIWGPSYEVPLYYNFEDANDYREIKFKAKHVFQEDVKLSPVSICMDLRTSLTKYINDLQKGKTTPIEVKKNIENYIKDLN